MTALIPIPRYTEVALLVLSCGHHYAASLKLTSWLLTGTSTWYCSPCGAWRAIDDVIMWKLHD